MATTDGSNPTVPGGAETILLAEDEELVRGLAQQMLEQGGYRVLTACDGNEAVEIFEAHVDEINLLLFDVVMPGLSGPDAYLKIKTIKPDIPILFMSGFASDFLSQKNIPMGNNQLLRKPYSVRELRQCVRAKLDGLD